MPIINKTTYLNICKTKTKKKLISDTSYNSFYSRVKLILRNSVLLFADFCHRRGHVNGPECSENHSGKPHPKEQDCAESAV